jgi:uncharacterized protein YebE (UPF0316 family)
MICGSARSRQYYGNILTFEEFMPTLFNSAAYTWLFLPILIFCARICDVSLDTVRIIFVNKNLRYYAAFAGFFSVLIWLLVIRQIFQQLNNPICYVAYAAGYATGNFVGILLENKISIGKVILRVITRMESKELVSSMRTSGYGVTVIDAEGATGPVTLIFTVLERCHIPLVVGMIRKYSPLAFYSIEDVRMVSDAVTPFRIPSSRGLSRFSMLRKKEH